MSASRFTPADYLDEARAQDAVSTRRAAMLRQAASDAEALEQAQRDLHSWKTTANANGLEALKAINALADLQRKVKALREWLAECGTGTGSAEFGFSLGLQRMAGNVLVHMDTLGLTPSPEQGASK